MSLLKLRDYLKKKVGFRLFLYGHCFVHWTVDMAPTKLWGWTTILKIKRGNKKSAVNIFFFWTNVTMSVFYILPADPIDRGTSQLNLVSNPFLSHWLHLGKYVSVWNRIKYENENLGKYVSVFKHIQRNIARIANAVTITLYSRVTM